MTLYSESRSEVSLFHVREIGVNLNGSLGCLKKEQFEYFQHGFKKREFLSPSKYIEPENWGNFLDLLLIVPIHLQVPVQNY